MQAAKEEAELEGCTFEPQLVSEQLVSHGRALRMSQALFTSVASSAECEKTGDLHIQQQQQQPKERRPKKKGHGQPQLGNQEGSPVQPSTAQVSAGARWGPLKRQPYSGRGWDVAGRDEKGSREGLLTRLSPCCCSGCLDVGLGMGVCRGGAAEEKEEAAESAKNTPAKSLLELAEMSMDPSLGGETEQVLKHLGEQDAAEFRHMQQELQQILLQSPVARGGGGGGNRGSAGEKAHKGPGATATPSPGNVGYTSSTHPSSVQGKMLLEGILL